MKNNKAFEMLLKRAVLNETGRLRAEAAIKLRPYVIVENDLREVAGKRTALTEDFVVKKVMAGKGMEEVFLHSIS